MSLLELYVLYAVLEGFLNFPQAAVKDIMNFSADRAVRIWVFVKTEKPLIADSLNSLIDVKKCNVVKIFS